MIIVFLVGYTCIALEHPLKINKSATALLLGVVLWVCAVIGGSEILVNSESLREYMMLNPGNGFLSWLVHLQLVEIVSEVSYIIFFLLGAMTIVELIDTQGGFKIITDKIKTTNKVKLLWVISILSFFMSAVLDNLTTSIVMCALLRKLIDDKKDRWFYASMIIIAANSGGAWSPIGDVTTIMLWIGGKITALNIIEMTFLASLMSLIVPLMVLSFMMKGEVKRPELQMDGHEPGAEQWHQTFFLLLGIGSLLFVPVFKTLTQLPPFLGMLFGLGVMWITSEIIHRNKSHDEKKQYDIVTVLKKVDIPSILFFLGILIAVGALQTVGHLELLASKLDTIPLQEPSKYYVINTIIGILSSIVDNVPLVAGAMGMYHFPCDHYFWEMLAYSAGTGGSILIIGSAAGVAVMGMEKIDFIWYLKKISWIALVGYFAGTLTFVGEKMIREKWGSKHKNQYEVIMTEEGVKDYLFNHTFIYDISDDESFNETHLTFLEYYNAKERIDYSGIFTRTYTGNSQKDSTFFYALGSNLVLGECYVVVEDTTAYVVCAETQLIITQSGTVAALTEYGLLPLKKKE
jgi:Na+/H+ antiporter NhaD/arsenite permease-like protein